MGFPIEISIVVWLAISANADKPEKKNDSDNENEIKTVLGGHLRC